MIEVAIADKLLSESAVTSIATGGVHQLVIPQHESRPAVRIQLIDQPRDLHLRGWIGMKRSIVQIDAFAQQTDDIPDAYQAVADLADAIEAALGPTPFAVGSPPTEVRLARMDDRFPFEPDEHGNYRMMTRFVIRHLDP